jgi:hypothetical protein
MRAAPALHFGKRPSFDDAAQWALLSKAASALLIGSN